MKMKDFIGFAVAAETPNFVITYGKWLHQQADADALRRAQAIAATCEADLATLEQLFGCDFQAGGRNRYTTWVHVPPAENLGGARNWGWARTESSKITIEGTYTPTTPTPTQQYVFDEFARWLFVCELAEILMDFTGFGWNRGRSDGEALSLVLGAELHPVGYYNSGQGPRVNAWLLSPNRPDWVTATAPSDTDFISFGCGILFINYLRHQQGYSLEKIIRTHGPDLADRFDALTAVGRNWAFPAFARILAEHIPIGSGIQVPVDNVFPLRDGDSRSVGLTQDWTQISRIRASPEAPSTFRAKAGFICKEREYNYWPTNEILEYEIVATGYGFATAKIEWSVNGLPLPKYSGQVTVQAAMSAEIPPHVRTDLGASKTTLTYIISERWNQSTLFLRNSANHGNYTLDVTATASETSTSSPGSCSRSTGLDMVEVGYDVDPQWDEDRRNCNPEFAAVGHSLLDLSEELARLHNAPDPPPDQAVDRVLDLAERVHEQIALAAHSENRHVADLRREYASTARISRELAAARQRAAFSTAFSPMIRSLIRKTAGICQT
ncbi:hypothetical protein ACU4GG_00105 [Streptomyces nojiriensis]